MGLLRKMRAAFHDDWCPQCQEEMEKRRRRLFALPQYVGHYESHQEPDYYRRKLVPVQRKAEIPTGMYACGAEEFACPLCGYRHVRLTIFLPVRDQEKFEDAVFFKEGELDGFLWQL